jgi:hypothetical protein
MTAMTTNSKICGAFGGNSRGSKARRVPATHAEITKSKESLASSYPLSESSTIAIGEIGTASMRIGQMPVGWGGGGGRTSYEDFISCQPTFESVMVQSLIREGC